MNINGYKIERELGRGGMATVYLAIQLALERQVALKVMNPALAADEDFKNRFLKEGPIAARLNDPQIVTIYDTGTDDEHYFLAMEYLSGGTLKQKIKQGLALERALAIAKMLGSALGYAHSRNVLHRDFKPHNVLFRDNGTPVLTDFGIAKAVGGNSQMTIPGASIGSPMYMSPEQAGGKDLDYRSDIYSLGVVFYEMLAGKPPYQSKDNFALALMHINEPIPQLPERLNAFQPVLDRLLAKAPDDRFKIAEQFVEALKQAEQSYYAEQKAAEVNAPVSNAGKPRQPVIKLDKQAEIKATQNSRSPGPAQISRTKPAHSSAKKTYLWWGSGVAAAVLLLLSWLLIGRGPDIEVLITESETLFQQGELEDSLNAVEKGLAVQADNPILLALQDKIQTQQDRLEQAEQFLEQAVQLKQEEQLEESWKAIDSGLQLAPENAELLELKQEVETLLLAQRQQIEISNLLVKAQQQFQEQRLLEPAGDNAFESYMQALELDKENETALNGLQQIASQYLVWAQASRSSNEPLNNTRKYVEKGLTVWPGHEGLISLRDEVAREAQKLEGVQKAIADARQYLQQNDFQASLAVIKSGLEILPNYQELLDLEQDVLAAQAEAQRLAKADEALQKAQELQQQDQLDEALNTIAFGLDYAPEHDGLLNLQQQINTAIELKQRQQQADDYLAEALDLQQQDNLSAALGKIEQGLGVMAQHEELLKLQDELRNELNQRRGILELLVQAEEQLENRQLTLPEGNNALETYKQILAIDPANADAENGLNQIAEEYLLLAEREKAAGQLDKSLDFIAKGLAVRPQHSGLLAFQEAIQSQNQAGRFYLQAKISAEQGELEKSLQEIEQGLDLSPLDPDLLALQTQVLIDFYLFQAQQLIRQQRLFDEALAKIEAGLELNGEHRGLLELKDEVQRLVQAEKHLARARELQQQGDLTASLEQTRLGLQQTPQHAELDILQREIEQQITLAENQRQAEQHLNEAKQLAQQNEFEKSLREIDRGLTLMIEHPGLLVLQNHVLAEQIRYQQAEELLQEAGELRAEGRLEQAMQVTLQGLQLAPQHPSLFELQQQLTTELAQQIDLEERQQRAGRLLTLAREQLEAGDMGAGLLSAEQGLNYLPQHEELQSLSDQLQEQLLVLTQPELELAASDTLAQTLLEVGQLLALADQQFQSQRLTRPAGNNAFENYQQVLALDPDNAQAKAGLQAIARRYLQWARSNKRKGNLTKSLSHVDKGLSVLPSQKELQALRREVVALLDQRKNTNSRSTSPPPVIVDPCSIDNGSKACWCKTFGMFCK